MIESKMNIDGKQDRLYGNEQLIIESISKFNFIFEINKGKFQ